MVWSVFGWRVCLWTQKQVLDKMQNNFVTFGVWIQHAIHQCVFICVCVVVAFLCVDFIHTSKNHSWDVLFLIVHSVIHFFMCMWVGFHGDGLCLELSGSSTCEIRTREGTGRGPHRIGRRLPTDKTRQFMIWWRTHSPYSLSSFFFFDIPAPNRPEG